MRRLFEIGTSPLQMPLEDWLLGPQNQELQDASLSDPPVRSILGHSIWAYVYSFYPSLCPGTEEETGG
jgi:hypothetical protein